MAQHFLLSAPARSLSLVQVMQMTDVQVETMFRRVRWSSTNGEPVCPSCGSPVCYDRRRANGTPRWRCKACLHNFSVTSGTLFANAKLPLRIYLAAVSIFSSEVKGKSMLALSRDLGTQYKTAFVMAHKIREAMASEIKGRAVGGEGKTVEIDGGYFGGYVKPANIRTNRRDRRRWFNQSGKRQCVVVIRQRDGHTLPGVFRNEADALSFIRQRVAKETVINVDEAGSWNDLHSKYEMRRINHEQAYSLDGACTNQAESFFSRMRRAEIGHHHHIAGPYLLRYAQEACWREDSRRLTTGEQVNAITTLAMRNKPSVDFSGYWQRGRVSKEAAE
jgi:transposase-like protein